MFHVSCFMLWHRQKEFVVPTPPKGGTTNFED